MKNKQKHDYKEGLAYVIATFAVFVSFLFWTYFVADIVAFTIWRTQLTVSFANVDMINEVDEEEAVLEFFGHACVPERRNEKSSYNGTSACRHAAADTKERTISVPKVASVIDVKPDDQPSLDDVELRPAREVEVTEEEVFEPIEERLIVKDGEKVLTDENEERVLVQEREDNVIVEEAAEDKSEADEWGLTLSYYLAIPDIDVNTEVYMPDMNFWNSQKWDLLEEQMQVGLNEGAVAYPHSATAGDIGTVIVAGHSSPPTESAKQSGNGHLFARLPELKNGDKILIRRGETPHIYEVIGSEIVAAWETSILLQQEDESLMKLITCYPVGTTKDRYVITARLVEG